MFCPDLKINSNFTPYNFKIKCPSYHFLDLFCNKSLSSGVFPERLKYVTIKPVYKKGDKLLDTNYRPISLLTSFSKIFEELIYSRLYKHICTNNTPVKDQYGFRIISSTEAASYNVIN